jgi:stage II sporulation protein P
MMRKWVRRRVLAVAVILLCAATLTATAQSLEDDMEEWLSVGEYFRMVNEAGEVIMESGRVLGEGDEYLTSENDLYRVVRVDADQRIAYAEYVEKVDLRVVPFGELLQSAGRALAGMVDTEPRGLIGVYHTHNAESYVPTDGTDSIYGQGGIHQVGAAFADSLRERGVKVEHSENLHLPHDRGAYRRSRETAVELLAQNPDAIFDVHRDAAPRDAYALQLEDEWVTSVQFVLGRQNQNLGVNREFAQSMKALADKVYPGLVKGIFFGRGNYNQDLSPLALLLEAGAHTNSREAAERGMSLFADVVDIYFYGGTAEAGEPPSSAGEEAGSTAAARGIGGLLAFVLACIAVFYVINAGGLGAALDRIKNLFRLRQR